VTASEVYTLKFTNDIFSIIMFYGFFKQDGVTFTWKILIFGLIRYLLD